MIKNKRTDDHTDADTDAIDLTNMTGADTSATDSYEMFASNTAADVVTYCKTQPMFREVNMARFLTASTTRREFFHVTRAMVETASNIRLFNNRAVSTYYGVSKFKQAFQLG